MIDKEREAEAEVTETPAAEQPPEPPPEQETTEEVAEVPVEAAVTKPKPKKGKPKGPAKPKKQAKPAKPTKKQTKAAAPKQDDDRDRFNFRLGSKRSTAAAMYSTGKGATLAEVRLKTGSVMLNMLKELMAKGYEVKKSKETSGAGKKQVTRYYLVPNLKLAKKRKKGQEPAETPQEVPEGTDVAAE